MIPPQALGPLRRLAWSPLLLAVLVGLMAFPVRSHFITPDGAQNVAAAANLLHEGYYSTYYAYEGPLDDPAGVLGELRPDARREPLTAWLMVPFLAAGADDWDRDCIVNVA